jgi:DNA-binding NtrC family response regulator
MAILVLTAHPGAFAALRTELAEELIVPVRQAEGLRLLGEGSWSLILVDAEFAGGSGLEFIERISSSGKAAALLARSPSMRMTLDAMQRGARDVLPLPPDASRVHELVLRCARASVIGETSSVEHDPAVALIGESPAMLQAYTTVARVAKSHATVLIRGESGTGKELLARVIHEHSPRANGPFVAVNCAAIPENLLESELFGHEKGAFTGAVGRRIGRFERATNGTIFLDEIGDMSLALQAKMLRALQEHEIERVGGGAPIHVDVRVIAATHRDLEQMVTEHTFREDLYYRLAVVSCRLPALRERGDDIRLLADYYVKRYGREYRRPVREISPEALAVLRAHRWPGNVRQLRNALEHAVLLADTDLLLPSHLPPEIRMPVAGIVDDDSVTALLPLAEIEKRHIRRVLDATGGHMIRAADILGVHRNTLRRKLEEYGLA